MAIRSLYQRIAQRTRAALRPVPEAGCTVCVPILLRPRDPGRRCVSAASWELAMLIIIQANHRALMLNALAVCAVFVFVGAVLLGAF